MLILATLLSSLVAGLLFAFAIVIMPGIKTLNDREFIRTFQVMDGVIQNNQPIFMLVWMGSALTLLIATVIGFRQLDLVGKSVLITATLLYMFGVQLPTIAINVPLNNQLQTLDVDAMNETTLKTARRAFEPRWNRWNTIRTAIGSLVTSLLITLLFIL
jgi:uncharacterized membrane protein